MSDMHTELETRLTRYCAIDSQSDAASKTAPSTQIQLDMARLLVQELTEIGAADITLTDYGTVLATLPATAPPTVSGPTIGFLAHVDTAPQFNAVMKAIHLTACLPITMRFPKSQFMRVRTGYMFGYVGPPLPSGVTQFMFCAGSLISQVLQCTQFCALITNRGFLPESSRTTS